MLRTKPAAVATSVRGTRPVPPPAQPNRRLAPSDALLLLAVVLWLGAAHGVKPDAMNDWGLLRVLPVTFFIAVVMLLVSIALVVSDAVLSPIRLGLNVVVLVFVLHGTVPLIFPAPNYPWVYKHIGVVGYINRHGRTDQSIDIYQNWPGFFALSAWFAQVAGVRSALAFAKWAPVYFNLLFCLQIAFILRHLPVERRVRWLALFIFVAGNWVGQDYFAPQAMSFVLSLAVFGMMLAWFHVDRRPALVRAAGRLAGRISGAANRGGAPGRTPELSGRRRMLAWGGFFAAFGMIVVSHQLSPYMVLIGAAILTVVGLVRPRWIVAGLAALAIGFLILRLGYLHRSHHLAGSPLNPRDLLSALSNPFDNAHTNGFAGGRSMPGRAITALAAPALIVGLWGLGMVGALRRLRAGQATLVLAVLAGSPALVAAGQDYGGEAIFRIFLFSLPWTACLAGAAFAPRSRRWSRGTGVLIGLALGVVVGLFMSAFYGSVELYRVRPGVVRATQYFYDHAAPGSVLGSVSPNIPGRLGDRYDLFLTGSTPPPLTSLPEFQHRMLGAADISAVSNLYQEHVAATPGDLYLSLSADQQVYAKVAGLEPSGSLASLDRALGESRQWRVFYREVDAVIYQYLPPPPGAQK